MLNHVLGIRFVLLAFAGAFFLAKPGLATDPTFLPVTQLPTGTQLRMYEEMYLPPAGLQTEGSLTLISDDHGNLMWVRYPATDSETIIPANTVFTLSQVQTVTESPTIVDGELTLNYGNGQSLNLFCRTREDNGNWAPCQTDLIGPYFEIRLPSY